MKELAWSHILSVGVEEIDEDHRRLVELFNILNHAVAEGAGRDYVAAVLEELINCTVWHFSHEERLMLKHGYPELTEHMAEHHDLVDSARTLQQKYLQTGKLSEEDFEFLEHWLTAHILAADNRLGSYLMEVM